MRLASWPRTMFTPTALMKPTMTALDTKRSTVPSLSRPAADHHHPGQHGQGEQGPGGVGGVVYRRDVGNQDGHGAGALHRHERRGGRQSSCGRAHHVAVHAGERVHARQQPGRQTVGDAFDPEHGAGNQVVTEVAESGSGFDESSGTVPARWWAPPVSGVQHRADPYK